MADFDAIKASEGPNAEAWSEIGAFIMAGRPDVDAEPDPENLEEINNDGEVADLDDDLVPEGCQACDSCGVIELEEDMCSGTYGPLCDACFDEGEQF